MASKEPFSAAGNWIAFSKSYGTNSLNTAKRSSNSSNVICGRHLTSPEFLHNVSKNAKKIIFRLTIMFFNCMKALGADTTAIRVSSVAPSSSRRASKVAVSSLYQNWEAFQSSVKTSIDSFPSKSSSAWPLSFSNCSCLASRSP